MRIGKYEIRKVNTNTTCLHPEFKTLCEFAFEIDGKEFYHFKNLLDMPNCRFQRANEFIREADMRISSSDLVEMLDLSLDAINKGDITDSVIFQTSIKSLASQYIETDTFYRLFTCLFFDLEEDVTDYDFDYNESKIELFKSQPRDAFFFNKPMSDYLPQVDISKEDLEVFYKQTESLKQYIQKIKSDYMKKSS